MNVFRNGWKWIASDPHHLIGARILQISIGVMLLFRVLTELPFAAYLWGPRGIGWGSTRNVLGQALGGLFDRVFTTEIGTLAVLLVLATAALALVLGYWTRMATILALVAFFLIGERLPELPDGGGNITQLVLTYMVFLLPPRAKPVQESIWVWLHNIAVLAIIFQLVIMYTTSGFAKMAGDLWQHGVAMYYIGQVQWFSLPGIRELFKNSLVTTMATYIPMFYQIMFPVAIISRIKLPWLALGILFHISISIFMGLVTFSTVMIGPVSDKSLNSSNQLLEPSHLINGTVVLVLHSSLERMNR